MSDANRKIQLGTPVLTTESCVGFVGRAIILPATDSLPSFLGSKPVKAESIIGTTAMRNVGDSTQVRMLLATLSLPADDLNN